MKIIALWDNYRQSELEPKGTEPLATCWFSDSCLLREGRPYYIPDYEGDYRLFPTVVLRIDRLGKGIQAKYASRYWHEESVWLNARACRAAEALVAKGLPVTSAVAYDNSLIAAPFLPIAQGNGLTEGFDVSVNGKRVCEWRRESLRLDAAEAIERVSYNNTLKTGDILMLGFPPEGIRIEAGDHVEITNTGGGGSARQVYNSFKIK